MRALPGCALALALSFGGAEGQSGTIVYNWVAPLDVDVPGEMAAVREAFEARRVPFVLHFTVSESLMVRDSVPIEHQIPRSTFRASSGNLDVVARILEAWLASEPHTIQQAYVGEDGSGVAVKSSLGGGVHRVDRGAVQVEWSITEEQREHLGYPVLVAVGEARGEEVEAWFAPAIPVAGGPAFFGGLPGMILVLSLNGGLTTYAATEISLEGVEEELIRMPEVGEVTSPEEYRTIIAESIRDYTQGIRRMVSTYGNVRCTVGVPGVALQCNQVRQGGPEARRLSNRPGPLQIGGLAPGPGAARAPHTFLLRSPS